VQQDVVPDLWRDLPKAPVRARSHAIRDSGARTHDKVVPLLRASGSGSSSLPPLLAVEPTSSSAPASRSSQTEGESEDSR
jgi:hypothetical protein